MRTPPVLVALFALLPLAANAASKEKDVVPSIIAQGVAEISVAPDRAVVRFGMQQQAATARKAQADVNAVMEKVMAGMKKLGVPTNKIRTDRLNLYPVYSQPRPGNYDHEPKVVGFRAANTISVELALDGKSPAVGAVLDAALEAGANSIEGVSFELANEAPHRIRALRLAAEDAKAKATTIAEGFGLKLGKLLEASEGGLSVEPPRPMMMKMEMARMASDTSVEPGEIRLSASVGVRYSIKD